MIGLIPALLDIKSATSTAGIHLRERSQKKSASNAALTARGRRRINFSEKKTGSSFHRVFQTQSSDSKPEH